MTADAQGNNLRAVGLPISGNMAIAPIGTILPSKEEGYDPDFILPAAFRKVGLIVQDGGFQWTLEPDGDAIEFWQDGYTLPSGLANATLVAKVAQYDDLVREVAYGQVPDEYGVIDIDAAGHDIQYVIYTEEIFKNAAIRRRLSPVAGVSGAVLDQSTRGAVNGLELTFKIERSSLIRNRHLREWFISAEDQES